MSHPVYKSRQEFRYLGLLHRVNAIGVGILLLTGLLLYAEPLRKYIAPVRVPLKYLHIAVGVGLAVALVVTVVGWGAFLVREGLHLGRRLNTVLTILWLSAWTVTGLLMWFRGTVSFAVANMATNLHEWLTWGFLPWAVLHVAFRYAKVRRFDERQELTGWLLAPTTRRALLYGGGAILGVLLLGRWFKSGPPAGLTENTPALPKVDPKTLAGGGLKGRFRYYFVNDVIPTFDPVTWRLNVGSKSYTWAQFTALRHREMVSNFHCVTGWSVFNITWEGVRLSDLLADAGLTKAPALIFFSGDKEYTESLTWEQAQNPDVMLAFNMDGVGLPRAQGGPVRLLVPAMYGYKSIKWVEKITATDNAQYAGYWELRGYPVNAILENGESVHG
jgi:sulfoxide reductase catalytic subunit YedY